MGRMMRFGGLAAVAALLSGLVLTAGPANARNKLPLKCNAYLTFHEIREPIIGPAYAVSVRGNGSCTGGLDGPYVVALTGSGGSCLYLDEFGNLCNTWEVLARLVVTNTKTGAVRRLDQLWDATTDPTSAGEQPARLFQISEDSVGVGLITSSKSCGALCQQGHAALVFSSP